MKKDPGRQEHSPVAMEAVAVARYFEELRIGAREAERQLEGEVSATAEDALIRDAERIADTKPPTPMVPLNYLGSAAGTSGPGNQAWYWRGGSG